MIDKDQWREFSQDTFTRSAMGFLMTTESQDLGLTSHPKADYISQFWEKKSEMWDKNSQLSFFIQWRKRAFIKSTPQL